VKWLEKLIILLVALFLLASGVGLFAFAMGWQGRVLVDWLGSLKETPFDGVVLGTALLLASLYLLAILIREQQEIPSIVQETELGQVEISLKAIANLVQRVVREVPGIKDLAPIVKVDPQGLDIRVVAQVAPGLSIPALANEVQTLIRGYLHETVGYPVHRVMVEVRDIRPDSKIKVD
jgi:uncharacterized alkaline shock family protein YloU